MAENVTPLPGVEVPSDEELLLELITKLDRAATMTSSSPERQILTLYGQASVALKALKKQYDLGTQRPVTEYNLNYTRKRSVIRIEGEWEDCTLEETERQEKMWEKYDR